MNSEKNADSRSKAQKVLQKSEQQGRNEYTIDYDERNPFSLDCSSLKPLYKGTPLVKCSYCAACYAVDYKGKLCLICGISTVSRGIFFLMHLNDNFLLSVSFNATGWSGYGGSGHSVRHHAC